MTNPQLRVDELGPPEFKSNDRFAKPMSVRLTIPRDRFVYDVRNARALGKVSEISVTLDPYEPTVFAVAPSQIADLQLSTPARVKRGETATVGVSFAAATPAANHVLHVDVVNPSGQTVGYYSGNLLAPEGHAAKALPIAVNDPIGRWEIRVRDVLTGQSKITAVEVF
jgi:hypothetical protein